MKDSTEIICVIDRSGSMKSIQQDAIGGFNSFLAEQQALPGEATITLALFDSYTNYQLVYDNVTIDKAQPLNDLTFVPRGMTALYDAVGKTIDAVGIRLHNTNEADRPNKILFVILTDGDENNSKFYSQEKIKNMINHQRDVYNWNFVFLAANQEAALSAQNIAISGHNAMNFAQSGDSINTAYSNLSSATSKLRSAKWSPIISNQAFFDESERDAVKIDHDKLKSFLKREESKKDDQKS
jgi:hypothetical protein